MKLVSEMYRRRQDPVGRSQSRKSELIDMREERERRARRKKKKRERRERERERGEREGVEAYALI